MQMTTADHEAAPRRAEDLDLERLGELMLRIPLASSQLRHTSLQSSLDYIHAQPGDGPELEYVRDFLTLGTEELIDRWFGGREVAGRASASVLDGIAEEFMRRRRAR